MHPPLARSEGRTFSRSKVVLKPAARSLARRSGARGSEITSCLGALGPMACSGRGGILLGAAATPSKLHSVLLLAAAVEGELSSRRAWGLASLHAHKVMRPLEVRGD